MNLKDQILLMPRVAKRLVVILVDCLACLFSVWISFYLRLGEFLPLSTPMVYAMVGALSIVFPVFFITQTYRVIIRHAGIVTILSLAKALAFHGLLYAVVFTFIGVDGVPRTIGLIQPIIFFFIVVASRSFARSLLVDRPIVALRNRQSSRVLIYGAGEAGRELANTIYANAFIKVVGFVDDNPRLHGRVLNGCPIYSSKNLATLTSSLSVETIFVAIPSLNRSRRNEILLKLRSARVAVRTLPSISYLASGKVSLSDIQELDIDDLLGRKPVSPQEELLRKNVHQKVVLVTGAGGSIGSELCRQICAVGSKRIILVEQNEHALYRIDQSLKEMHVGARVDIVPLVASVRDGTRMKEIFSQWRPNVVYHAAAYKHVSLVEQNIIEGIKNNVFGTLSLASAAAETGVGHFVLISTDKAVRPTNVMGATKRLAEMILQALNVINPHVVFSMVRFGNVLGSSGSVVPRFRRQLKNGGPLTLTHPDVTRFFMTATEAAQLVIQASSLAEGGDVFLLDMGSPVRIFDLAQKMIELSGLTLKSDVNPDGDIEIHTIGLRPGEKLYEELLIGNDPKQTVHPQIKKGAEEFMPWDILDGKLEELNQALVFNDVAGARKLLIEMVDGYSPNTGIVDWSYLDGETTH